MHDRGAHQKDYYKNEDKNIHSTTNLECHSNLTYE